MYNDKEQLLTTIILIITNLLLNLTSTLIYNPLITKYNRNKSPFICNYNLRNLLKACNNYIKQIIIVKNNYL